MTTICGTIKTTLSASLETTSTSNFLDQSTIFKAAQVISEEIELSRLVQKVIQIAKENAGATRAELFYVKTQKLFFAENSLPLESDNVEVPASIIQYVKRTKENLVIGNALKEKSKSYAWNYWRIRKNGGNCH